MHVYVFLFLLQIKGGTLGIWSGKRGRCAGTRSPPSSECAPIREVEQNRWMRDLMTGADDPEQL